MKLKKGKFLGAIVLSLFLLASCRSLKNTNTLFLSEYDKFADTAKTVYVANGSNLSKNNNTIQPYDLISVRNLQNPEGFVVTAKTEGVESAAVFKVNKDGDVVLPVIGTVKVAGLTQSEASSKLQNLYGKKLYKDPIIDVSIVNFKVTLLGQVVKPGNYVLERDNIDLIDLIGRSGGLMPGADTKKIKIIRGDRKKPKIIYVPLNNLTSLGSDELILENNDIVFVNTSKLFNISEGVKTYSGIIQPAFLILNTFLLIYTLGR